MGLIVEFLGLRGSLPTPYPPSVVKGQIHDLLEAYSHSPLSTNKDVKGFMEILPEHILGGFGGNTMCVSVQSPCVQILVDAGTGLRYANEPLMKGPCGVGKGEAHIFMTHFHWDHVIGLPFFTPLYVPGNKINLYAVQKELKDIIPVLFKKPHFPVPFEAIAKNVQFHNLAPRTPFRMGDMTIVPYQLDHPDPCWGYRIESGGKVYAHCVDTEATRTTPDELGPDVGLYTDVDLMCFDSQYTVEELKEKINWGHSSVLAGLKIAMQQKIKKIVFAHHDPFASDGEISRKMEEAVRHFDHMFRDAEKSDFLPTWCFGIEGMKINL